jgi:hypothetical protein
VTIAPDSLEGHARLSKSSTNAIRESQSGGKSMISSPCSSVNSSAMRCQNRWAATFCVSE